MVLENYFLSSCFSAFKLGLNVFETGEFLIHVPEGQMNLPVVFSSVEGSFERKACPTITVENTAVPFTLQMR